VLEELPENHDDPDECEEKEHGKRIVGGSIHPARSCCVALYDV